MQQGMIPGGMPHGSWGAPPPSDPGSLYQQQQQQQQQAPPLNAGNPGNRPARYQTRAEFLADTPTRRDGIGMAHEMRVRRTITKFMERCGKQMNIPFFTVAIATIYFHKYFMTRSLKRENPWIVAAACMFLACKVEETRKRLSDIIATCWAERHGPRYSPMLGEKRVYLGLRDRILLAERHILYVLKFHMTVKLPYKLAHELVNEGLRRAWPDWQEGEECPPELQGADKEKWEERKHRQREIVTTAWGLIADSLKDVTLLQFPSDNVAHTWVALSARLHGVEIPDYETAGGRVPWYEAKGTPVEMADEIIRSLTAMYDEMKNESTDVNERTASAAAATPGLALAVPTPALGGGAAAAVPGPTATGAGAGAGVGQQGPQQQVGTGGGDMVVIKRES